MKSFGFGSGIFILFVIVISGYYFYQDTYTRVQEELAVSTPRPTSSDIAMFSPSPTSLIIPSDWVPFSSKKYGYTLRHPKGIKTETTSEGDSFLQLGPTQSIGTELYDGISVAIKSSKLNKETLQQIATKRRLEISQEPTTQSISQLEAVSYATASGFLFRTSSLGEAEFIYMQKSPTEYLEIINATVEPKNRDQTFQNIVTAMISSITF